MKKTGLLIAILAACACATSATGASVANAAAPARASVTIRSTPALYGYVASPRTKCAKGRVVSVMKAVQGKKDKRIARAKTRSFRGAYQWSLQGKNVGQFYARVDATRGCKRASSKLIKVSKKVGFGDIKACPSADGSVCLLAPQNNSIVVDFFSQFGNCSDWAASNGNCDGHTSNAPSGWLPQSSDVSNFHWNGQQGGRRDAAWYSGASEPFLTGSVPNPASERFSIKDGVTLPHTTHWCTADIAGVPAGRPGGPLFLDYTNGRHGTIHFWGYLIGKKAGNC